MARAKMDDGEIANRLTALDGWSLEEGKLHKEFKFADFNAAFAFMTKIATVADRMDHHPEWFNVYNRVAVDLMTHDAGGISDLDFALAAEMDTAAGS
ncbi:MAG: 4a-hydroxytetrahydrobiopterin dehydratase [Alphaproteobacteria bacterium]|nr:4a-hydroxytetrahydrobiopterin dehydratase [Alphaproteobacteria bacterium]MCZ6764050.1 4a-hydroxytetrahydrobiopterin dehydratase [Alphaproteobacteria bacterium]